MVKHLITFFIVTLCQTWPSESLAATHFECFNPNFNAATQNFYVDGKDVYWSSGKEFIPLESYANPNSHHIYLGNGRFKHLKLNKIISCKATSKKFSKPVPASAIIAISLCRNAIVNDYKMPNPVMPKKRNYKFLTNGELKVSEHNEIYGDVVIEAERYGWFFKGLYLVTCQVDLMKRTAFVNDFYDSRYGEMPYYLWDWYVIKSTDLIKG